MILIASTNYFFSNFRPQIPDLTNLMSAVSSETTTHLQKLVAAQLPYQSRLEAQIAAQLRRHYEAQMRNEYYESQKRSNEEEKEAFEQNDEKSADDDDEEMPELVTDSDDNDNAENEAKLESEQFLQLEQFLGKNE